MSAAAATAVRRYKQVQVKTSSPGELLTMLFDGLLKFLEEARSAMESGDRPRACERINRSHAIISELFSTLDPRHAPELCENLVGLYTFCLGHLLEANIEQNPTKIADVARILSPLAEAFRTAAREAVK
jgi:flagellar secretion chaperone FliS